MLSGVALLAGSCAEDVSISIADEDGPPASSSTPSVEPASSSTPAVEPASGSQQGFVYEYFIRVDQFGYRPSDPKVAVIADPQRGYDEELDFEAGTEYQVRRWSDDEVVFAGSPEPWRNGAVQEQSGDRGWWFDFSAVTEPGTYYVIDIERGSRSGPFEIATDVYDDVLDAAIKMFWFNRANSAHLAEFGGPWSDAAAYVGPGQDTEARWVDDPDNPTTERDLSGGWFDAGDTSKYVTFAAEPVHQLLTAYERSAEVFDDSVGIPESGNGIPDLIDEIRWEIDWLEKMQQDDGGVLTKLGSIELERAGTPSLSRLERFYEEACSSATIAAAGMFAHAALVFGTIEELEAQAQRLGARAEAAWDWYQASEKREDCDPQIVLVGDADRSVLDQQRSEVVAAVYLLSLTGDDEYDLAVRQGYGQTVPFNDDGFGRYGPEQADALLHYRALPGADPEVRGAIEDRISAIVSSSETYGFDEENDLYRSFMPDAQYHWGSNRIKASIGTSNLTIDGSAPATERALGHLHYFHGVNPLATVYLSNMYDHGAERSVESLFHFWFGPGTEYDVEAGSIVGVPPGYVVGGPNAMYSGSDAPPAGQPPQKSYRDWSGRGSDPAWEITEPAIGYQAAYVRLLGAVLAT